MISTNCHATEGRYKYAKNGLCKGVCRLRQKFHKTKAHDEMTEICRFYNLSVNKINFLCSYSPEL